MSKQVVVEPYNPDWANQFAILKDVIWPAVNQFAVSIEHVGSTAVPGLAAKPIIDIDIVIPSMVYIGEAIRKLAELGYEHRGNLGIEDREAFRTNTTMISHHLYVCPANSLALKNHLVLRDTLRSNLKLREEYAAIKTELAKRHPDSIDSHVEGKTDFILKILKEKGYDSISLESIRTANLSPKK